MTTHTMTAAQAAIARSISHNEIVHIDQDAEAHEELSLAAEDSVWNDPVTEYWGTTEDGSEWRVHVHDVHGKAPELHWTNVEMFDAGNNVVSPESDAGRRALAQFRATGTMRDVFFARVGGDHETEDDASTWGPPNAASIDWSGFARLVYNLYMFTSETDMSKQDHVGEFESFAEASAEAARMVRRGEATSMEEFQIQVGADGEVTNLG